MSLKHKQKTKKKKKKLHRRNVGFKGQHDRRVMFAYGDASLPSSMRSFTPTPSKVKWIYKNIQLYLIQAMEITHIYQKKGIVILVDEYRTSRVRSHCKNDLQNIVVPERGFDCDHKHANIINIHSCTRH